ncbi:cell division protein FtsA [Aurantiacibacter atlanticus]|uniref:Cell division protein FtsA n=1 Tax=Aurantiacibacter atlanticus TaxID=1648404 RepID=A0A0H4VZK2_9SPHN|nr:cell division protein FtsA [Aurantiacibacter atlanticus]AKQ42613.1 cell division protein FtsA [Aurantiacibacter atlanticus]MDF1835304.1 cell division protein FtsA [Alteraurantiacibacter sp. bin_em_oilr2.035]
MAGQEHVVRHIGAVNIGSFRVSAMIAALMENGEVQVIGSSHRASQGISRGFVVDMAAATHAVHDALDRAEKFAGMTVENVWIGCSGAGLTSEIRPVEISIGGRRIEDEDIEALLLAARDALEPDGRSVLHAQPACYFLDGAHGVANPKGLHAERLGVDIHVMLADGAPVRNVTEAVQNAHFDVEGVVASPLAAGFACLTAEERDLGVAMVEFGGEVTNVSVYAGGMLVGLTAIARGSNDITDAIASAFSIRRFQAERLKCVNGSAISSPTDHREMIPVTAPGEEGRGPVARGADDRNQVPRAELIGVITGELDLMMREVGKALEAMGFAGGKPGSRARQVVVTGGGAELAGLADYAQSTLGVPVRIGKPLALKGLPEAHSAPGFATLAGLVLYAAEDPIDIRSVGSRFTHTTSFGPVATLLRVWTAMKEYF